MSNSFIQVAADGPGKQLQTFLNSVSAQNVHAEAVTPVDSTGIEKATASNPLRVDPTGTTLQPVNNSQWAGVNVSAPIAVNPVGTETAPVVRNIVRKGSSILSTTPLGSAGNFTSSWFDTTLDGTTSVEVCIFQDVTGNTFSIQECDDTSNTRTVTTAASTSGLPGAGGNYTLLAKIAKKYWRVNFTNGAGAATVTEITATTVNAPLAMGVTGIQGDYGGTAVTTNNAVPVGLFGTNVAGDGIRTAAPVFFNSQASCMPVGLIAYVGPGDAQTVLLRTPNTFKTAKATATGTTAVWTPAAGKKFRLMAFKIQVTANSNQTAGGVVDFDLQDNVTSLGLIQSVFIPTTAVTTGMAGFESGWIDLGNGKISSAINQVLNLVFTATGFAGAVRVVCTGTEE